MQPDPNADTVPANDDWWHAHQGERRPDHLADLEDAMRSDIARTAAGLLAGVGIGLAGVIVLLVLSQLAGAM